MRGPAWKQHADGTTRFEAADGTACTLNDVMASVLAGDLSLTYVEFVEDGLRIHETLYELVDDA